MDPSDLFKGAESWFDKGFVNVYNSIIAETGATVAVAQALGACLAIIYIGTHLWKFWASGKQIDIYALLKPIAIALCLTTYTTIFIPALDTITFPLEYITEELRLSDTERAEKKRMQVEEKRKELESQESAQQDKNESELKFWDIITGAIDTFVQFVKNWAVTGLTWLGLFIFQIIASLVIYCLKAFVICTKAILYLIGPIVLALEILPAFSGVLKKFVLRYINICLYVPVANIIAFFMSNVLIECYYAPILEMSTLDFAITTATGGTYGCATNYNTIMAGTFVSIIGIILYCCVPKISNWIIGTGDTGIAGEAGNVVKTAALFAAGTMGGALGKKAAEKANQANAQPTSGSGGKGSVPSGGSSSGN